MNTPDINKSDLLQVLDRMKSLRVLVVGDVMLDHYVWGEVDRISPEAPVPVVHVLKETFSAGGAANVALNLASLGVHAHLLSTWGADSAGSRLTDILESKGIGHTHSIQTNNVTTIVKKRIVARTQQLCRVDYEGPPQMYSNSLIGIEKTIGYSMREYDAVILSDYAKGVVTQSLVDTLMTLSVETGTPVAVDPKPTRKLNFRSPWMITPNRQEALIMSEFIDGNSLQPLPIDDICRRIHANVNPEILVVTLGADGMVVSLPGQSLVQLPTLAKEVYDVSGAGDTVIATLVAATLAGKDCFTAARIANAAAGCVVAHLGTIPVDRNELEERIIKL